MSVSRAGPRKSLALTSSYTIQSPAMSINESESIEENITRVTSADQFNDSMLMSLVNYVINSAKSNESIEIDELRLVNKQITGKGIKALNSLFQPNIGIKTIDLSHTRLGPAAIQSLTQALGDYQHLKSLLLANVEAGDRGCMALADMLVRPEIHLQTLDLRNNQIGTDGGRAMVKALQLNKSMRRLLIGGNTIDQEVIEQINGLISESKTKLTSKEESVKSPTSLGSNTLRRPTILENAKQFKRPDFDSINAIDRPEVNPIERIGVGSAANVSASIPRNSVLFEPPKDFSSTEIDSYNAKISPSPRNDIKSRKSEYQQRMSLVDAKSEEENMTAEDIPRKRTSIIERFRRLTVTKSLLSITVEELNLEETIRHCQGSEIDKEQFEFLLKRVKKSSVEAMFSLGYLYDIGAGGVDPNTTEAIKWYREAAQNGHAIAMNNLGVLLSTGHRSRVSPEYAEASHWYRQSAEKGYISGQFHTGLMYILGTGMEKPHSKKAFHWFKQAGKQGHVLAQSNVGAMYMNGKGTEVNYKKAMKWSKKAAAHMNAVAIHNIGVMYERGYGCKPDHERAEAMLEKARSGRVDALIQLELSHKTVQDGGALMNL